MADFKSDFMRIVHERGMVHQCSDTARLDELLSSGVRTAYIGFDCTADSLHVGHLLQIMLLRWWQKSGHKPIALMGGGTTKVGDPSGRDETRQLLTTAQIDANMASIKKSFANYLTFGDGATDAEAVAPGGADIGAGMEQRQRRIDDGIAFAGDVGNDGRARAGRGERDAGHQHQRLAGGIGQPPGFGLAGRPHTDQCAFDQAAVVGAGHGDAHRRRQPDPRATGIRQQGDCSRLEKRIGGTGLGRIGIARQFEGAAAGAERRVGGPDIERDRRLADRRRRWWRVECGDMLAKLGGSQHHIVARALAEQHDAGLDDADTDGRQHAPTERIDKSERGDHAPVEKLIRQDRAHAPPSASSLGTKPKRVATTFGQSSPGP